MTPAERARIWGPIRYRPAPTPGDPEAIELLDRRWLREHTVVVRVPQLATVPRYSLSASWPEPPADRVRWDCRTVHQVLALWAAWERAGLLDRVLSYDGDYCARLARGTTELSSHAYGVALDINARWNRLGAEPAALGTPGCVRELVPMAEACGFACGLGFAGRPDGMHFEIARMIEGPL